MKYAVIDIGSNSVRLMVNADGVTLYKRVKTTRLGEGLAEHGSLSPQAMERTAEAVEQFCREAEAAEGVVPYLFATEAVRRGANREEFLSDVLRRTGITVDVLSGETEALIGFLGAAGGEHAAVLDIGGASTELSVGKRRQLHYAKSVQVGVVRLRERCGENRAELTRTAEAEAGAYADAPRADKLYGIGGSVDNLAAAYYGIVPYDPKRVHGARLTLAQLAELQDKLYAMTPRERLDYGIAEGREDLICGGITWLIAVLKRLGYPEITVSENDNLEGYLKLKMSAK